MPHRFKLKYAPHEGMFKHHVGDDIVDQIKYAHDQGFTAWEDNRMPTREPAEQERIGKALADLNMTMGVFVAQKDFKNPTFALNDPEVNDAVLKELTAAVDIAKRCGAKWTTVVPGCYDMKLAWDYQTANVIEVLKRAAEIYQPHGLVMVLEPLNRLTNHPGLFLAEIPQAYMICKAVNSPACKILFDLYHQQITEGNLIPNIDQAWSEVAYFQCGDNPGRQEPTTGEINYRNVFKHIHGKGFDGIMGMEHGVSGQGAAGEDRLVQAYVECDDF